MVAMSEVGFWNFVKDEKLAKRSWIVLGLVLLACPLAYPEELVVTMSIIGVDKEYANIRTSFSSMDWDQLGVTVGTPMVIDHKGTRVKATFVENYHDVSEGSWLALVEDNQVKLAISFGHACEILDCVIGDQLTMTVMRPRNGVEDD